jgi:hypothetical protein
LSPRLGVAILVAFWASSLLVASEAKFINRLHDEGYITLSVRFYEKALSENEIENRNKDAVFLKLYKAYNKMSSMTKDEGKIAEYSAKAEKYFGSIKNSDDPEIKLERVTTDMEALQTLERKSLAEDADLDALKRQAKEPFGRVVEVTSGISAAAREWLTKYDEMDDKEQRRVKRDFGKQTGMEINATLKFGEACVIYASLVGSQDPEVREWLLKMAKVYDEFINNYFGSGAATVGSIYYGQACVLLGKFKNEWKEEVDGKEQGRMQFEEAIAALEEYAQQSKTKPFAQEFTYKAYTKHAKGLEIVGDLEASIDVHKKLFEWKELSDVKPSKGAIHDQMMFSLQDLCKKLQASYDGGNKDRVNDLAGFVLQAYNFTKKYKSKWHPNFERMLKNLPTDDPALVETTDIAYNKAKDLYRQARLVEQELKKAKSEEKDDLEAKLDDAYFAAAMKYKRTLEMLVKDKEDKFDDIYPDAAYSLGMSLYKLDNHLMALTTFLRAVELYPSNDYPEDQFPEIYGFISKCARYAKGAATQRYTKGGGSKFDKELFEKTLNIIKELFPEEGSDPEYLLAYLQKMDEKYASAKGLYAKISPESKMYYKSQYGMVDCDYLALIKKIDVQAEKGEPLEGEQLKLELNPVVKAIEDFVTLCRKEIKKPDGMLEKDFKSMVASQKETMLNAYTRLSRLYERNGDYAKTHEVQSILLENLEGKESERFRAYRKMVSCSYKLSDEKRLIRDIEGLKSLKPQMADPAKKVEALEKKDLNDFIANALRMQANIVISGNINPMNDALIELKKGPEREAHSMKMAPFYLHAGELFLESLKVAEDKDDKILRQVISYFYTAKTGREKALDALNLYFEWYPDKPLLDQWVVEMRGKDLKAWHGKIFGDPELKIINIPSIQKVYDRFLDEVFDTIDFSGMSLSELQKKKREIGDRPRNYQAALDTLEELEKKTNSDALFKKVGWPKLAEFRTMLKEANNYYGFRFMQAECYSILGRYEESTEVYAELASYFVEYAQIRIELAIARFKEGTPDALSEAKVIFSGLLKVVPKPNQRSVYKPRDFFSLQMWSARTKLKMMEEKDPSRVISAWQYLRSAISRDLGYFSKDPARYRELKIPTAKVPAHEALVDEIKTWVSEEIFPVLKDSDSPLSGDSWDKILGEDA